MVPKKNSIAPSSEGLIEALLPRIMLRIIPNRGGYYFHSHSANTETEA